MGDTVNATKKMWAVYKCSGILMGQIDYGAILTNGNWERVGVVETRKQATILARLLLSDPMIYTVSIREEEVPM